MRRCARAAVDAFVEHSRQQAGNDAELKCDEFKVTFFLTEAHDLRVYCDLLPGHVSPCRVEVAASAHRPNPTVKSTDWVVARQALEASMAPGTNEVLLCDPDTLELFEGTQTNFFVLASDGVTLQTAPEEFVLAGTVQRFLLEQVLLAFPKLRVERRCPLLKEVGVGGFMHCRP